MCVCKLLLFLLCFLLFLCVFLVTKSIISCKIVCKRRQFETPRGLVSFLLLFFSTAVYEIRLKKSAGGKKRVYFPFHFAAQHRFPISCSVFVTKPKKKKEKKKRNCEPLWPSGKAGTSLHAKPHT